MATPGLRQRVIRGAQGQGALQVVRVIVQVGGVFVLAGSWGLNLYGEWLILAAVPLVLTVSDIGLFAAGSTDMTMRVARGDRIGALRVFQAVSNAVAVLFVAATAGLIILVTAAPLTAWLNLELITESAAGWILVVLGLNTLVASYAWVLYGGFTCEGRYGEGTFVLAAIGLVEFIALATAVLLGGEPEVAAISMFAVRLPCTLMMYKLMRRRAPWLRLGVRPGARKVLRPLLTPALASAAFPAGFAMNVQGMVLLVGIVLGPASAAVFSTLRTMSRAIIQLLGSIFQILAPEISRAFAENDIDRLRSLHRRGCQLAVWLAAPILVVLALFGEAIVRVWTSGAVSVDRPLLYLFLAVAALDSLWSTSLAVMYARNRHQRLATFFFLASALTLLVAYAMLETWGLQGAAMSLVLFEVFMLVVTVGQALHAVHDTLSGWLLAIARPPPLRAMLGTSQT